MRAHFLALLLLACSMLAEPAAAQSYWDQAQARVTVIAARIPAPELRQAFLARPELRALLGDAANLAPQGGPPPG